MPTSLTTNNLDINEGRKREPWTKLAGIDMDIYVALLRGINVGSKNRVKMADLQGMFLDLQLGRVQTYIQSGNVLFTSDEDEGPLRKRIEEQSKAGLGFPASVVLRTATELRQLIMNCPFSTEAIRRAASSSEVECFHVALLVQPPRAEVLESLDAFKDQEEDYRIVGRDVYLLLPHGIRQSKLAKNLERLGVPLTVRNWRTLSKLDELAQAIGD
jgi:uncharacterized protein (DUF1697 family)